MELRHMHKSLMLQQTRPSRPVNRRDKENDRRPSLRPDVLNEGVQQKFRSILQKQKNNLNAKNLKSLKPNGKENHSFVNGLDKENQMRVANKKGQRPPLSGFGGSEMLRQNGSQMTEPGTDLSISKLCQVVSKEHSQNLTSIHSIPSVEDLQTSNRRNVFNNLSSKNSHKDGLNVSQQNTNITHEHPIIEESYEESKNDKRTTKLQHLVSTQEIISERNTQSRGTYLNNSSLFGDTNRQREACDPLEFCLRNIGDYYNQLIQDRGQKGSIACGGDIFKVQKCLKENMRVILFDWLLDLCMKWKMKLRTFVITITFTDAVLMKCTVTKEIFQLVGLACLFIAGKFEEIYPPSLEEYLESCNNAYSRDQLLQIETIILNSIQFNLVILNHLDILELNLKQRLLLNNCKIKIYQNNFSEVETKTLSNVSSLAEMFLVICMYDYRVHLMDMNQVVDFCIVNALRFSDLQGQEFHYKGLSSKLLKGFEADGKDVGKFLQGIPKMSIHEFLKVEIMMKEMMKKVFDTRQYSIIIKYRQFFVKTLRTYFDMI